jgi:hypothetical protein
MPKSSEILERQVSRIHELLERSHERITWNDRIPDPDNPEQLRQIDVTIRRDDKLTLINVGYRAAARTLNGLRNWLAGVNH